MYYIGIDPGQKGACAVLDDDGTVQIVLPWDKMTPHDICAWIRNFQGCELTAFLERVHAMPKQGVSSTFKFGTNYGWWQGVLTAFGIRFEQVTPNQWQTKMKCKTKGDKNVTKRKAQELFPNQKVTHATADALLIAEYARRWSY